MRYLAYLLVQCAASALALLHHAVIDGPILGAVIAGICVHELLWMPLTSRDWVSANKKAK